MRSKRLLIVLLGVVLLGGLGAGGWFLHVQRQEEDARKREEAKKQQVIEDHKKRMQQMVLEQQRDRKAYWDRMLPQVLAPAQLSSWLEADSKLFADAVILARPKVIVVPPVAPSGAPGIDISGRITIARQLSALLDPQAEGAVDPAIAYRALGEPRAMPIDEMRRRLQDTQAEWLIVGSASHDGKGKMRISLSKVALRKQAGEDKPAATWDKDGIEIGGPLVPELQFAPFAAEAVRALGFAPMEPPPQTILKSGALALPRSPFDATKPDMSSLEGVWLQQLLAVLYVPYHNALPRPRDRAFERTLAALIGIDPKAPDRALLMARALAYLDRREAALRVLAEGGGTVEERAFAAYLNADLPALASATLQIKRPAARLVSELELLGLRHAFGTLTQQDEMAAAQRLAKSVPEAWQAVVALHVLGLDLWTLPPSASVKLVLDRYLPVAGYRAEEILRGRAALGATGLDAKTGIEIELSPLVHARKWREANAKELCCASGRGWAQVQRSQYMDLLEADADRLAVARLEFLANVQGQPDQMAALADLYDQVLFSGGHPGVVHQRLLAAFTAVQKAAGPERARIAAEAFEHSRKLLTWETSQSAANAHAIMGRNGFYGDFLRSRGPMQWAGIELPPHETEGDVPTRFVWAGQANWFVLATSRMAFRLEMARQACVNTIQFIGYCYDYVEQLKTAGKKSEAAEAIRSLIKPRFNGNGKRLELLASLPADAGGSDETREMLRNAVRAPGAPMSSYTALGEFLMNEGDFAGASQAFLSFPGLRGRKENSVAISNYAGHAASLLARRGAWREAHPLLERTAQNADGSYLSLWAAGQLALGKGDYAEALLFFRQIYQRYRNPKAARLIASMLFMTGEADAAWSALGDVLPLTAMFSPYRAVPVGMRMAAADENAMLTWRAQALQRAGNQNFQAVEFVEAAFFQRLLIDRTSVSDKLFKMKTPVMMFNRPGEPAKAGVSGAAPEYAVSQTAQWFMSGYLAFRNDDHAGAILAWNKLINDFDQVAFPPRLGDQTGGTFWAGMTYLAVSLAKTGKAEEAKKLPDRLTKEGRPAGSRRVADGMAQVPMPNFDRKMIQAIVEAFAGNHAAAQKLFRAARGEMAEPEARVIPPEYAFVEILEFLAKETGNPGYIELALEFTRGFQLYEPWAAWACAFEAANSKQESDRIRAAARALKLDPASARLRKVNPALLQKARDSLSRENPFRAIPSPAGTAPKSRV